MIYCLIFILNILFQFFFYSIAVTFWISSNFFSQSFIFYLLSFLIIRRKIRFEVSRICHIMICIFVSFEVLLFIMFFEEHMSVVFNLSSCCFTTACVSYKHIGRLTKVFGLGNNIMKSKGWVAKYLHSSHM